MPLNQELLKSIEGLTPEQITQIETLSKNDSVNDIAAAKVSVMSELAHSAGLALNTGEDVAAYGARIAEGLKGDSAELNKALEAEKLKVSELDKKLKEGAQDKGVLQKLADAESRITEMTAALESGKTLLTEKEAAHKSELLSIKVDADINSAVAGLKFKDSYTEDIQKTLIKAAKGTVLGENKADYVEGVLVFRGADGNILRNKDNALNPFTVQELIKSQLTGALAEKQQQGGAGSGNGAEGKTVSISGAKTQIEADKLIAEQLAAEGVPRGTSAWSEKSLEMREAAKVESLPIK